MNQLIIGGDISLLQRIEEYGGVYRQNGLPRDALNIFKDYGFNYVRLRLFHTPNMEGPVVNNLYYTLKLAQRIKREGLQLLLNFHYSDTWADPGHQLKPAAWIGLSFEELEQQVFEYTRDVIRVFNEGGVLPDMVQVGNEITPGMLWDEGRIGGEFDTPKQWEQFGRLVKAGVQGVLTGADIGESIQIMIHIDRGGDKKTAEWFFKNLLEQNVKFDVIGLSYYPWWHGTFDQLRETLAFLAEEYTQDINLVEISYPWNGKYDYSDKALVPPFPVSPEGQRNYMQALVQILRNSPRVNGIFYWAPEWIPIKEVGTNWGNLTLFDNNGEVLPAMAAFTKQ